MTKAQKLKAKLTQQRLDAMKAAGMLPPTATDVTKKEKIVYTKKKKGKNLQNDDHQAEHDVAEEAKPVDNDDDDREDWEKGADDESVAKEVATEEEVVAEESSGDEWDADSGDGIDAGKFDDLANRLKKAAVDDDDEDVDLIAEEKRMEQVRLKELGLKIAERERAEALKRAEMEAEQDEHDRQAMMIAQKKQEGKQKREEQEKANLAARKRENLRCPIVVIMGHVDTGKTKLLDKIRKTNVQEGEAGGITQQIGATYFEQSTLHKQTEKLNETEKFNITVPGMLIIDTPGHESFANLRSRGSSLCDVAILVIDLMHGLEQQTIESLKMLLKRGVPFVVALNKIDRCYAWKTCKDTPIRDALKEQPENTLSEFRTRATNAKVELAEQGVNSNLYWEMGDDDWENSDFIPLVPTSAVTGEEDH